MGLRQWIAKALLPYLVSTPDYERVPTRGKSRPTGTESLLRRYESWVYKCASINAAAIAAVPLHLYVKGGTQRFPTKAVPRRKAVAEDGVQEITDHPMLDMLQAANPLQTGVELQELTVLYQELTGNAYWYMARNALGVPEAIYPLMPQYTTIVPGQQGIEAYLYGRTTIEQVRYEAEEVIQFRYPNPSDLYYGWSPLQAALRAVDRNRSMADYQQEFFDNSARIDFAITVPTGTPAAERDAILKMWLEKHQHKSKRHLPGVLTGDMDIKTFSFSPQDAALIEAAKFSREEIANIFGVPMTFLEISTARAEAEAHQYTYALYTLTPRLRRMEQVINERLVPMYDQSGRLFVEYEDCVPENEQLEIDEHDKYLRNFTITINEVRADKGLEPVEYGDMPINPSNGMPILTKPEPPPVFGQQPRRGNEETPPKMVHRIGCTCNVKAPQAPLTEGERELQRYAEKWFSGMRADVISNVEATNV